MITENKPCKIHVSCNVNSSEDPSKVKIAILNVFPELKISLNDQQLIGESNNISSLSNISASIHTKNTKNIYKRILKKNSNENSTWFYLNKQAAFVDVIAICNEADESPLGPIKIVLHSKNIEDVIEWLVSDTE